MLETRKARNGKRADKTLNYDWTCQIGETVVRNLYDPSRPAVRPPVRAQSKSAMRAHLRLSRYADRTLRNYAWTTQEGTGVRVHNAGEPLRQAGDFE